MLANAADDYNVWHTAKAATIKQGSQIYGRPNVLFNYEQDFNQIRPPRAQRMPLIWAWCLLIYIYTYLAESLVCRYVFVWHKTMCCPAGPPHLLLLLPHPARKNHWAGASGIPPACPDTKIYYAYQQEMMQIDAIGD